MKLGYVLKNIIWAFLVFSQFNKNAQSLQPQPSLKNCLTISDYREANFLQQISLSENANTKNQANKYAFALSFIHSVSLTPVVDYYQVKENKIIQIAERFEQHGAGLPSNINEGQAWLTKNNYFWLLMERKVEPLIVRTNKDYQNRLWINRSFDEDYAIKNFKERDDAFLNKETRINKVEDQNMIDLNQWPDTALLIVVGDCR